MSSYAVEREGLLQSIVHDQEDLQQAIGELKVAAQRALDLGAYIAERPVPWLVGAFMFGFWLGMRRRFGESD